MAATFSRLGWRQIAWFGVLALCLLCLLPPSDLMLDSPRYTDKGYHVLAYTILMWWFAVGHMPARWGIIVLGLSVLGLGLEVGQSLTPYREASIADELANVCGIALGYWMARLTPAGFPPFRQAE